MMIEDVIKKSILPLAFILFWFWIVSTIMKVSGKTDLFWWIFLSGLPFGIHKMRLILISKGMDITATLGMAALSVIIGALIGSIMITGKLSLEGTKEKGIDDYTGTYTADYENFSDTEYVFGGTSIKREAGKELSIDCTLEVTEGTAKVFWISGSDEAVTLIEATGTYSDTITLPDGGNYIGIECEDFTGNIELNIE